MFALNVMLLLYSSNTSGRLKINFDDDLMEEDGFMPFYFYVFFFLFQSFSVDYRKLNIFPF